MTYAVNLLLQDQLTAQPLSKAHGLLEQKLAVPA